MIFGPPENGWAHLSNDATPEQALENMQRSEGAIFRDIIKHGEFTFATVTIDGKSERCVLRTFPGVYAMSLPEEYALKLEFALIQAEAEMQ